MQMARLELLHLAQVSELPLELLYCFALARLLRFSDLARELRRFDLQSLSPEHAGVGHPIRLQLQERSSYRCGDRSHLPLVLTQLDQLSLAM
jgi:hypothetical protein